MTCRRSGDPQDESENWTHLRIRSNVGRGGTYHSDEANTQREQLEEDVADDSTRLGTPYSDGHGNTLRFSHYGDRATSPATV